MAENLGSGITLKQGEKHLYASLMSAEETAFVLAAVKAGAGDDPARAGAIKALEHTLSLVAAKK